ncbi:MAG: bifunctional diaminohydroxyphosphoribosylaminopyrimidine deaminase/5-amino-6-(5-phosphoribosylamino)uracil reductase RibD [Betaproteobacteria bacterium]|nr:bifunctional diaminohydroxyphosphoribosylaminopyrimidine deaminase/5-amino-6-(5-phosphoribosylamino)uracil reductase RibD [Betaproteobacteria bacterium]
MSPLSDTPSFSAADHAHMATALRLAERGMMTTTPNPRVGCLIVADEKIIGSGWHRRAGEPHAEALALAQAGTRARGATVYVTLEPCAHHGRTPPCADALIAAGVRRVVAAVRDPNPLVAGQGLARLAAAGIETGIGLLDEAARELNIGFFTRMTQGRPWMRLKAAASLDGKTALADGQSQWITGEDARQDGHRWRARACAILSASGTVRHDDPRLNPRGVDERAWGNWSDGNPQDGAEALPPRAPLKVIVDSRLELSPQARLFEDGTPALIATATPEADPARIAALQARGAEIVFLPEKTRPDHVDLSALCAELARRGINEVHVEAGRRLNGALIAAGLADELLLYLAPRLIGADALDLFALPPLSALAESRRLAWHELRQIGEDLRIIARFF